VHSKHATTGELVAAPGTIESPAHPPVCCSFHLLSIIAFHAVSSTSPCRPARVSGVRVPNSSPCPTLLLSLPPSPPPSFSAHPVCVIEQTIIGSRPFVNSSGRAPYRFRALPSQASKGEQKPPTGRNTPKPEIFFACGRRREAGMS